MNFELTWFVLIYFLYFRFITYNVLIQIISAEHSHVFFPILAQVYTVLFSELK